MTTDPQPAPFDDTPPNVRHLEAPEPPDDDHQSQIDRRYLQLSSQLVDATRLELLPRSRPLIHGHLDLDSLNWLHGKPGSGKSFVALDWAAHVATGLPWCDNETHQGRVLYVLAEGAHGMDDRRQAWQIVNHIAIPERTLFFLPTAVQLMKDLDTRAVTQLATELDVAFIVLDTQARVTVGADENSAKDMGQFINNLEQIRVATGACVLLVHHESRGGDAPRGSTAIEGAANTVVRATKDGSWVRLDNTKQKDGPEFDPVLGQLVQVEIPSGRHAAAWSHQAVRPGEITRESEQRALDVLRDLFETTGASATTWMEATGMSKPTFYRAVKGLVTADLVRNAGTRSRSLYVLTDTEPLA